MVEEYIPICGGFEIKESDFNSDRRFGCKIGYEQAEKDLMLTWEDAYKIVSLAEEVKNDFCDNPNMFSILKPITVNEFKKVFNEEILRRFNEWRDKK